VVLDHGIHEAAPWEKQVPLFWMQEIGYHLRPQKDLANPASRRRLQIRYFRRDLHKIVTATRLRVSRWWVSRWRGEVARYFGKYGSKGVNQGGNQSAVVPPFLLKTKDNPEAWMEACLKVSRKPSSRRYAFFTEFFKNFYNTEHLARQARPAKDRAGGAGTRAQAPHDGQSLLCAEWHGGFPQDLARIVYPTRHSRRC